MCAARRRPDSPRRGRRNDAAPRVTMISRSLVSFPEYCLDASREPRAARFEERMHETRPFRRRINERVTNGIAYLIYKFFTTHRARTHACTHTKRRRREAGEREALDPEATERRAAELRPEHARPRILWRLIRP